MLYVKYKPIQICSFIFIKMYNFVSERSALQIHPLTILCSNSQTSEPKNRSSILMYQESFWQCLAWRSIYKLHQLEVPKYLSSYWLPKILNIIMVKINNSISGEFTPEQGVPQGSLVSPTLYNVYYCHDMVTNLT